MGASDTNPGVSEWSILGETSVRFLSAGLFTFWAGAINGVASIALVFGRVSHMSGRVIDQGQLALYNPLGALFVSTLLLSFFAGTVLGGLVLSRLRLTRSLLLAMVPIFAGVLMAHFGMYGTSPRSYEVGRFVMAFLLSLGMGMQNSVTSQTSIGRTTHMTGELTDLGISVARRNWPRAFFLFIKYLAFLFGAMFGYVGVQNSALLTLLISALGVVTTTLYFEGLEAQLYSTYPRNEVFRL